MVKKNAEKDVGFVRQFNELKKKHPDAVLLFRKGDFYEMYKEDALKASVILALKVSDKILPLEKDPIKLLTFPRHELDKHLPKLIRSGQRVAICEAIDRPELMKKPREKTGEDLKETNISNKNTMAKKKKEQAVQEEPTKTVKMAAEEKPAKEMKSEQQAEAKQERKPREPQMITANGEKVSHGHAFQSTTNPADWYFTAKIDGVQLKPQKMDAADLAAYQKKEMTVPQLMERYYPTKLMPKVSEEAYQMPKQLSGPDGAITIDKFNVYKEKDEQRPDYGKYKFYVQMGDTKMSAVASREDLNAYFDRVVSPTQLVEKNFGERLHLQSAYEKYQLPEGVDPKGVRVAKDHSDNKWKVSMDLGDKGKTSKHELSFDDGYSLFKDKDCHPGTDSSQVPQYGNHGHAFSRDQQTGEVGFHENVTKSRETIEYSRNNKRRKDMTAKKTHEELVELLQAGKIGFLRFVMDGDSAEDYLEWCQTHGTDPSDESAEFYVEQTDIDQMDRQVMDDESYGVWN